MTLPTPPPLGAGVAPASPLIAGELPAPRALLPRTVPVAGNELTLFVESTPLIESMVRDIRAARTRVWLEVYIFFDDDAGRAVADALAERARAGVEVRVLYDAIGSQSTPSSFFRALEEAGASVHCFHSLWEALWKFSFLRILNRRDHRKLLVIDDRVAYFGGMNVVNTASAATVKEAEHLPTSAGWRDVHVRLEGLDQRGVADSFDRSWRRAHGEKVPRRPAAYRRCVLARGAESIQFFDSGPGLKHTRAHRLFSRLLRAARRRITLSMAYFLPVGGVLKALLRAPRRGVLVRVVVPGESDVPLVQHATRYLYSWLLKRRIRIFERLGSMLHSKVMIVDRAWAVVGSCNLDARSLRINLEFLAVIHSRQLAQALEEIVTYEIAHSERVTPQAYRERTWWRRLVNRLAWSLRWWL
jgi:cardiolipin synthase A/B